MHLTKTPGPDTMPALFYKKYWHIVSNDVKFCLNCLNGFIPIETINQTHIVLIPKVNDPTQINQFLPISLCNVIYRIIAKVLVNKMKHTLPCCISKNQSAFFPNRLITVNVIVAYKMIHSMKHKRIGNNGVFALKLDMSKAYDRVEWNFLAEIMAKLGFNSSWVTLIMNCVKSISYSIVINGCLSESLTPERGLRQGDPLSPYLYLMCIKALLAMLSKLDRKSTRLNSSHRP